MEPKFKKGEICKVARTMYLEEIGFYIGEDLLGQEVEILNPVDFDDEVWYEIIVDHHRDGRWVHNIPEYCLDLSD